MDLFEEEEVNENEAREFAKKMKAEFKLVSAKTGENVDDLFRILVNKYERGFNKNFNEDEDKNCERVNSFAISDKSLSQGKKKHNCCHK